MYSARPLYSTVPLCSQNAAPGAHGWNMNSPSSLPTLRWSRFLRFLEPRQVRLEVLVAEERRAVHPLHRLVLRVALPVRARRRRQLEGLQLARRRDVRAAAEVDERLAVLDRVDRDLGLPLASSPRSAAPSAARHARRRTRSASSRGHSWLLEHLVGLRQPPHLGLDLLEILGHERASRPRSRSRSRSGSSHDRADAALRAREQLRDGCREQVGRAVPIDVQRVGAVGGEDLDARVLRERVARGRPAGRPPSPPARPSRAAETRRPPRPERACRQPRIAWIRREV